MPWMGQHDGQAAIGVRGPAVVNFPSSGAVNAQNYGGSPTPTRMGGRGAFLALPGHAGGVMGGATLAMLALVAIEAMFLITCRGATRNYHGG